LCADLPGNKDIKEERDLKEGHEANKTSTVGTTHCGSQDSLLQMLLLKLKT
jgi:hypothetical protein